jgi:tRNA wybutosine-synthesizing protein 1
MDQKAVLKKQHYIMLGQHSATKLCHWVGKKLLENNPCYKEKFYGIECHRCIQLAPSVSNCTQSCLFCWRYRGGTSKESIGIDDPEQMIDRAIEAQKKLVSGFRGDPRCDKKLWDEARAPKHVAISLSGEPTLYEHLSALLAACKNRGLTTFLVTNGTMPEVIEKLDPLPDQLYLTIAAPDEETYRKLCIPLDHENWEKINRTLQVLPSLDTRKVVRHTLVKGYNMSNVEGYAALDSMAEPDFIECKAYMFVGYSREVMSLSNMPSHEDVASFSAELSMRTGYRVADEKTDSRVVLLDAGSKDPRSLAHS